MASFKKNWRNKNIIIISLMLMFFVLDRYLKTLSFNTKPDFPLLGNFLKFTFFPNQFISFSIPWSGSILNIVLLFLLVLIISGLIWSFRKKALGDFLALSALFLGAASNFFDRIRFSYVIDYLSLSFWSVFNLADVLIAVACLYLIIGNFNKAKK